MATRVVVTNQIGDRGENAVALQLSRPTKGHYGFEAVFLGAKAQNLDFRVALLDAAAKAFGPHFFVQVKARQARAGQRFSVGLTAVDLLRIRGTLTPIFVAGVEVGQTAEKVWMCAVTNQQTMPSIPKTHDLSLDATRLAIYTHVLRHFTRRSYSFKSSLT